MNQPAMKIRYHQKPIGRPAWLTDIDDLNAIAVAARLVCLQPDKYHIAYLRQVLEDADLEAKP